MLMIKNILKNILTCTALTLGILLKTAQKLCTVFTV